MDGRLCNLRLLALVLLLCAAPSFLQAQQFVCSPIHRGDTASRLARRLTGNPTAAYSLGFQVRDPARQMFVPKSHYLHLSTRWEACVAADLIKTTARTADVSVSAPIAYSPVDALATQAVAPPEPAINSTPLPVALPLAAGAASLRTSSDGTHDDVVVVATIASTALVMWLMYAAVDSRMARPIPPLMRRAGEQFVAAFARPLIDPSSSVPPIHARLRFIRRAQQLEISIAPGAGRRYPNLVDHKANMEHDVNRVMQVLGKDFVRSDRLRAAGRWVVVSIRPAGVKQTGAK